MKLNIGCGRKPLKGYISIDSNPNVCPDILRDLNKGLPFSDNSIDEIVTIHCLEHIKDITFLFYEMWRVLKPGKKLIGVVPINQGWSNYPTHITPFGADTMIHFTDWNVPEDTGYKWKLFAQDIVTNPKGKIFDELHFVLIKKNFKPRKEAITRGPDQIFTMKYKEVKNAKKK